MLKNYLKNEVKFNIENIVLNVILIPPKNYYSFYY